VRASNCMAGRGASAARDDGFVVADASAPHAATALLLLPTDGSVAGALRLPGAQLQLRRPPRQSGEGKSLQCP
jgi:hypothetical protein